MAKTGIADVEVEPLPMFLEVESSDHPQQTSLFFCQVFRIVRFSDWSLPALSDPLPASSFGGSSPCPILRRRLHQVPHIRHDTPGTSNSTRSAAASASAAITALTWASCTRTWVLSRTNTSTEPSPPRIFGVRPPGSARTSHRWGLSVMGSSFSTRAPSSKSRLCTLARTPGRLRA
jgi:hypothetical protein